MDRTPKLTLDQELQAAVAIIRIGLDRLQDAACRTADPAPHAAALRAIYNVRAEDDGILAAVSRVIGTISQSITDVDDDRIDDITGQLDEAESYVLSSAGERIGRALDILGELIPPCEECGQHHDDVEVMPDPFSTALYPEETDHRQMPLCPPCAVKRFEES
ncbi:hypothetical protein [Streptomyces sp. NPDC059957]|uniref:hypothetical protein n=1 Tax=unclassified Streptomyces TaxID=2593676 RepID=UPI00364ABA0E